MPRVALAGPLLAVALLVACGRSSEVQFDGPRAEPLEILARGEQGVRGPRSAGVTGVAVRSGRRVVVIAERRTSVTAASTQVRLVPDLDGDGQPEVAATLGRTFAHRLVVTLSAGAGRRTDVARSRWDVIEVAGRIGARWLVVAADRAGIPHLAGYLPRQRRWTWTVPLPGEGDEIDDVDVRGDRIRLALYVPTGDTSSTVLDITARGDGARVTRRERRPAGVRTTAAGIGTGWRLEEVLEPVRESGERPGRVELTLPGGDRRTLSEVDDHVPGAALLRADRRCALVLLNLRGVVAVAAGGDILARQRMPPGELLTVAAVGRRLLVRRREDGEVVVRALRTDRRVGSCAERDEA